MLTNKEYKDIIEQLTPVEQHNQNWIKRDDTFEICGVRGGKARSCMVFIQSHIQNNDNPPVGVISGGSRSSPQVQIVGKIAKCLGLRARLHIPKGGIPQYIQNATIDLGHEVFQWFPGFNHVINSRVKTDISNHQDWLEIPFGMEFPESVECTASQVKNLPFQDPNFKRIIVPVGSGMSLIGIFQGLTKLNKSIPILGIIVGKNPTKTLNKWLPPNWKQMITLLPALQKYHTQVKNPLFGNISLDPIYEAKVIPFIQSGDLLWVIGHR